MKKNTSFFKVACLTWFSIVLSTISIAQTSEYKEIQLTEPVCIYKQDFKQYDSKNASYLGKKLDLSSTPCATFKVNYIGFTDEARLAFQYAVDIWAHLIDSPVPISVVATFEPLEGNTLGSAGAVSLHTASKVAGIDENTWYVSALYEKLIGRDRDQELGESDDIRASFNSNFNWYFGTDGNAPDGLQDFVTVVLHELGHGLGFSGSTRIDEANGVLRIQNRAVVYNNFIVNGDDVSILDFPDPSPELLTEFTSNNLFSNSPLAIAGNNNVLPKIHAPSPYVQGSSYSHWDEGTFERGNVNSLMTPTLSRGEVMHHPGPSTLGLFENMGWSICTSALNTNDLTISTDVSISPNPFNNQISLNFTNLKATQLTIKLTDIKGSLLYNQKTDSDGSIITLNNVGNLQTGIYFLTISDSESNLRITKKIIKN
ncbi:MAG: T9SS type A sorting domain-containing protein [Polaribacter sp.]|uniref:T9SS type A sorting domain-containing protein n=1 Tax=Polaribacter sp. TaxID=1920175 RepID=UPI003BAE3BB7